MPPIEICCLANSRKHGGKCIAGIHLASGQWVRPVAAEGDGRLTYLQTLLEHVGREPRLLDCIRIPLGRATPAKHQPENMLLAPGRWQLVHRPQTREEYHARYLTLQSSLAREALLFGTAEDRIPLSHFDTAPAPYSLLLIQPESLTWQISQSSRGTRQTRALFHYQQQSYALSVTDPVWEAALQNLPFGTFPRNTAGITPRHVVWFTVSLGEPMPETGQCFKLVAAVLIWPPLQ